MKIKIGVLGAGHLGKIHLRLLKGIEAYELMGFYDASPEAAARVAGELGVRAYESVDALLADVDAVDIVTPTTTHFELASRAVKQFKHIFIEKPITSTVEEARALMRLVAEAGVKAQVGHVERFNPAFLSVKDMALAPMFIEGHRLAQWNPRGTDVSVVLDLMIHDLDIVHRLVKSGIKRISASGVAVVSETPDIANARIEFNNGAVANLTASRISVKNMRRVRLFQKSAYVTLDFLDKRAEIYTIHGEEQAAALEAAGRPALPIDLPTGRRLITIESPEPVPVNSIQMELEEFARAIRDNLEPAVTVDAATTALQTAYAILEKITPFEVQ